MRLPGLVLARTLVSPCFGREPKDRVATHGIKQKTSIYFVKHFCKIQLEHNQWLVNVSFILKTLSKMNLSGKNVDWSLIITSMKIGYNLI
jgi:hypothetical protein